MNKSQEKHYKYLQQYKKNEIYWGIGIENELYLEFEKKININKEFLFNNHKRERYSVNYFDNYKNGILKENLIKLNSFNKMNDISVPLLINSHSFLNTDSQNNARTLYTKSKYNNPLFKGITLLEEVSNFDKYFINNEWLFDGDTVEFTTMRFYKVQLNNIIFELKYFKYKFINILNKYLLQNKIFNEYGTVSLMKNNYPIAIHLTNLNNISIFNNGTLHYNITLPTFLDENCKIKDFNKFIKIHKDAIKMIQWLEPFMISVYNTADYFNNVDNKCSNCSQRCAVSRYIGIGTFDTDEMIRGKILQVPVDKFKNNKDWWYVKYHQNSSYKELESVGLDINFNKHYNHGIEIRFFDHILNEEQLFESFEFIILLMDFVLDHPHLELLNPIHNPLWNNLVYNCMKDGHTYSPTKEEILFYTNIFNIEIDNTFKSSKNIKELYYDIYFFLLRKYTTCIKDTKYILNYIGPYSKLSINNKIITKTLYNKILNISENNILESVLIDIEPKINFDNTIIKIGKIIRKKLNQK
jgi:hypothetical protein